MIKFPKVHIATSVVSRILDLAEGLPDPGAAAASDGPRAPAGAVSDTAAQSQALDAKLAQATPDVGTLDQAPDPGATLSGRPLLDTMLTPGQ